MAQRFDRLGREYYTGQRTKGKRSRFESKIYDRAIALGYTLQYEPKDAKLRYVLEKTYVPDFVLPNGIIVEAKGWFTSEDRTKMIQVKKANPEADIRFLFQADNRIRKGSKTYYSDWAKKHGFPYAVGKEIPEAWFHE